jgi:hypothetical protein
MFQSFSSFFRSEYLIDIWESISFGVIGSKKFLIFVLIFPLIVSVGYLIIHLFDKYISLNYYTFSYLKGAVIFFSFVYFFFFVLILIDFIYYVEVHKLFFSLSEEQIITILAIKKNK